MSAPASVDRDVVLKLDRLRKEFVEGRDGRGDRRLEVLDDLSFEVRQGEFLSVIGPSGCGKTTLLQILGGLDEPSAGSVRGSRESMAFVFQRPLLLPWRNVLGNALFSMECQGRCAADARGEAEEMLRKVGLGQFLDYLPHQLSEGMKQRVNLARALLVKPRILLMDEPFASLDVDTRASMHHELLKLWREQELTVVFVSHNLEEVVFLSDRVVFLSDKPSRIRQVVEIDLPRPRGVGADAKVALVRLSDSFVEFMQSR
ncbi:MAG: hypothetical protein CME06_04725 [Gemmatimonadetes bacterium]|nr:hypothetical protein [Gemmatimonadota bacterium]